MERKERLGSAAFFSMPSNAGELIGTERDRGIPPRPSRSDGNRVSCPAGEVTLDPRPVFAEPPEIREFELFDNAKIVKEFKFTPTTACRTYVWVTKRR